MTAISVRPRPHPELGPPTTFAARVRRALLALVSAALVFATLALCVAEYFEVIEERQEYSETVARMLAENSEAAFKDKTRSGVKHALEPLVGEPSIIRCRHLSR